MTNIDNTPTFDLTEVFPDPKPEQEPAYTAAYNTIYGDRFEFAAFRGVQMIGRNLGKPINATEGGHGHLTITDADGNTVNLKLTPDFVDGLRDILHIVGSVMESRDPRNDKTSRQES